MCEESFEMLESYKTKLTIEERTRRIGGMVRSKHDVAAASCNTQRVDWGMHRHWTDRDVFAQFVLNSVYFSAEPIGGDSWKSHEHHAVSGWDRHDTFIVQEREPSGH